MDTSIVEGQQWPRNFHVPLRDPERLGRKHGSVTAEDSDRRAKGEAWAAGGWSLLGLPMF